jgi:hypothetical protein
MGTSVTGNLPTGVSATTLSTTSIRVYWTRDPVDLATDTVIVMLGSNIVATVTAPYLGTTLDSATVTGLTSNIPYTIIIGTEAGRCSPINYQLQFTYLPTNVAVTAQTLYTITVTWTRNPNDTTDDTLFVITSAGSLVGNTPIVVPPLGTTATVTGISAGVTYVIVVGSLTGRSTAFSYISPYPGNLMVNAMNSTSIGAVWTRGGNDTTADTIVAMNGGTVASTLITSDFSSSGVVSGLQEMVPYVISVHARAGVSDTITWMTAERDSGIHIYERADSILGDSNVLILKANGITGLPFNKATNADFVLDDDTTSPSGISLDAGSNANLVWNKTMVNPDSIYAVGGLNNYYRDTNYLTAMNAATTDSVHIPNDTGYIFVGSRIVICKTASGNLALIEIVPNASTSQLYTVGSNGYKYITVNVSYQAKAGAAYAGRGHARSIKPILKNPINIIRAAPRNPRRYVK